MAATGRLPISNTVDDMFPSGSVRLTSRLPASNPKLVLLPSGSTLATIRLAGVIHRRIHVAQRICRAHQAVEPVKPETCPVPQRIDARAQPSTAVINRRPDRADGVGQRDALTGIIIQYDVVLPSGSTDVLRRCNESNVLVQMLPIGFVTAVRKLAALKENEVRFRQRVDTGDQARLAVENAGRPVAERVDHRDPVVRGIKYI